MSAPWPWERLTPARRVQLAQILGASLFVERGPQGEPWLRGPADALAMLARRGWAEEYRVTPGGQTYYRLSDAGRDWLTGPADESEWAA